MSPNKNDTPFEIAEEVNQESPEKDFKVDPSLFYCQSGTAEQLKSHEGWCDYGLQNNITVDQVAELVDMKFQNQHCAQNFSIPNFIIIDCRFKQEFEGGHIQGAVNISSPD